jgi:hypothetical protein
LGGKPLGFELGHLAAFIVVALAGLRYGSGIIAAGWIAHAGWDALHHLPTLAAHAPEWYVTACIVFDVVLAGYMFLNRDHFTVAAPHSATIQTPQPE